MSYQRLLLALVMFLIALVAVPQAASASCDDVRASLDAAVHAVSAASQLPAAAASVKKQARLVANATDALQEALNGIDGCDGLVNHLALANYGLVVTSMLMSEVAGLTPSLAPSIKPQECRSLTILTAKDAVAKSYEALYVTLDGSSNLPHWSDAAAMLSTAAQRLSMTLPPDTSTAASFIADQKHALADAKAMNTADCNAALSPYFPRAVLVMFFSP